MRKNLLIATIFALAILPLALAATTVNVPATGQNYTAITFNCTTALSDTLNMSVFYNVSGGATGTYLGKIVNTSASQTEFVGSLSVESLADGVTYNFTCKADDGSSPEFSAGIVKVGIDNTNPTCSASRLHKNPAYKDLQEVTWATADATSSLASTAVTIDRPGSGSDMTYTDASRTLQLTSQDTKYIGSWTATVVATDTAGNSNTCSTTWTTYMPDGEGTPGAEPESNNLKGVLIIVGIGVALYFIFKGK